MSINNDFKEAVANKDEVLVRIMLKDSMILDPTFTTFDELSVYASERMESLYVAFDGDTLNSNESDWDKDFMNLEMVKLMDNFSKERVAFLRKVCKVVYADKYESIAQQNSQTSKPNATTKDANCRSNTMSVVGKCALVAGGTIAIAGIVTSKPVVTAVGVTVAIAGGVAILLDSRA